MQESELDQYEDQRLMSPQAQDIEDVELSLRPRRLREYIGQQKIKDNLDISIQAALGRGEPLDHLLLSGPPGLGKTTLAHIIANEMGVTVRTTSGPAIERAGDLAAILTNLEEGSVLFIDEIHRLNRMVEEILYPAMEDFTVDIIIGKGPSASTLALSVKPFTLIGATTRSGLLSSPLRDRFGIHHHFVLYNERELDTIVHRSAEILNVEIEPEGAIEIARRSRGTPRIANRVLKRVCDFAQVRANGVISKDVADGALGLLEIDRLGLDAFDRRLLGIMIEKYNGGPVGVETLAAATGEERDTIEDVYEPFLLQLGFLARTPRGRMATAAAYEHLGFARPGFESQPGLYDSE